jgi:hypothetical protein
MNFYIGNSIEEINEQDYNIEFSDDLINYIYQIRNNVSCDMSKLYQINPYSDVEVSQNDLPQIIAICKYILDTEMLKNYDESNEGTHMVEDLLDIAQNALSRNLRLISIGD